MFKLQGSFSINSILSIDNLGCAKRAKLLSLAVLMIVTLSSCKNKYILPELPLPNEAPHYYQPVIGKPYRIQVSDKLQILSYYDPQLNQSTFVLPDGTISLMLIGEVSAVNKTPKQLSDEIKTAYNQYLDNPDLNVVIKEISPRRIYIGGKVKFPSVHVIENSLTLMQAITLSRGFENTANENQVLLLRLEDEVLRAYQIDTFKILSNEIPDVYMEQNDIVFVPETVIANLNLFVEQYLSNMVPNFIRVNFGLNHQIGTIQTEQNAILTTTP